jgi:hypothetical protein
MGQAPQPQPALMPPGTPPTLIVDLMSASGASALGAQWRVSEVKIKEVPAIPGTQTQSKTTYDIEPHAGGADFDDSKWPVIEPKDLAARRSGGHVAFMVSHPAHDPGEDRRLRSLRCRCGVASDGRRLCRSLGQRRDPGPFRISTPGQHRHKWPISRGRQF